MPTYATNKKARFDYTILETLEAGIVLSGSEVKAVRQGNINLKGAFVAVYGNRAELLNAYIGPYKYAAVKETYDPSQSRTLLLHQKEIAYLQGKKQEEGLTIVPLSVYTKGRQIKIEIGVAKGKKQYDKRESVKNRDIKKEMARRLKGEN